jgi:FG-GAP repeat
MSSRRLAGLATTACLAGLVAPWSGAAVAGPSPISAALTMAAAAAVPPQLHGTLGAADGAVGDVFGHQVAMSGNTIVVASPGHSDAAKTYEGAVYVFTRPAGGWANLRNGVELRLPGPATQDYFSSIAIDGNTVVVGNEGATTNGQTYEGAAYVYQEPASGWKTTSTPTATLTASDGAVNDYFGLGVTISGDTIVVGAVGHKVGSNAQQGAAYVFTKSGSDWTSMTQTAELTSTTGGVHDQFGTSLAISGNTIVVTAPLHTDGTFTDAGLGYVFVKPTNGPWVNAVQNRKLEMSDPATGDGLGSSFGAAIEGNTIVLGASHIYMTGAGATPGAAYVFTMPAGGWGASGTHTTTLTETAKLTATGVVAGDYFGGSVAISGNVIAVGAIYHGVGSFSHAGGAYLFDQAAGSWKSATQSTQLANPTPQEGGLFGFLALSGTTLVVGAQGQQANQGAAFVFQPAVAPTISRAKVSPKTSDLGKKPAKVNPTHKPKGGTEFSFTVSEAATVSLSFSEKVHGALKHRGTIKVVAKNGRNTVWFDGVISAKKSLAAGRYVETMTAKNADGISTPKTLHITIVKPHKH